MYFLNSILLPLVFLDFSLESSSALIKCYRCGTLTRSSGPGQWTNATTGGHPEDAISRDPSSLTHNILDLESCDEFDKPGSPSYLYQVTCGEDRQICAKIVTHSYEEAEDETEGSKEGSSVRKRTVQRGCAHGVSAMGQPHPIGCGFLYAPIRSDILTDSEHICYCDSNYCNSAPVFTSFLSIFLLFIFWGHFVH